MPVFRPGSERRWRQKGNICTQIACSLSLFGADGVIVIPHPSCPFFSSLSFGNSIALWGSVGWGSWRWAHSSRSTTVLRRNGVFQHPFAVPGSRQAGERTQDQQKRTDRECSKAPLTSVKDLMKMGKQRCERCFCYFLKAFNLHWFQSNGCCATWFYLEAFQWIFHPVRKFFIFFQGENLLVCRKVCRWISKHMLNTWNHRVEMLREKRMRSFQLWPFSKRHDKIHPPPPGKQKASPHLPKDCSTNLNESSLGKRHLGRRFDWLICGLCPPPHVYPPLLVDNSFLFVFIGMSTASLFVIPFFFLFFLSLLLPQLSVSLKEKGFGDPSDPNLTLDGWSSLSLSLPSFLPPLPSSPLFHPNPPPPMTLFFFFFLLAAMSQTSNNF